MLELLIVIARALALTFRGHRELVLENLALRQQLTAMKRTTRRRHLQMRDRLFWIALARVWRNWRTALVLVQPEDRRAVASRLAPPPMGPTFETWAGRSSTSRSADPRPRPRNGDGEPAVGAPRIHGELRPLGVHVSERTVSRLLERHPRPPSQTWRTFLTNHLASAASMDFFTVPTLTGRVLFVLVVLAHHRRRIMHVNITDHPTAMWSAQQVVDAFPDDTAPRWLHRDRDRIYGDVFQRRLAGMGITEVVSAPASPWQNPYAERLIGSIRRECLDHMIIINETRLRRVLTTYSRYYHRSRTHLGLEKDTPDHRPVSGVSMGPIIAIPEVGGLHHRYERRAA